MSSGNHLTQVTSHVNIKTAVAATQYKLSPTFSNECRNAKEVPAFRTFWAVHVRLHAGQPLECNRLDCFWYSGVLWNLLANRGFAICQSIYTADAASFANGFLLFFSSFHSFSFFLRATRLRYNRRQRCTTLFLKNSSGAQKEWSSCSGTQKEFSSC